MSGRFFVVRAELTTTFAQGHAANGRLGRFATCPCEPVRVSIAPMLHSTPLSCRPRCGACCIAPSISSPIPGMEGGKPAGVPCIQLDENLQCKIFGHPDRPAVCAGLQPSFEMCGENKGQAMFYLTQLEIATDPRGSVSNGSLK
ncbi:YkgJ family cysteine cluster protein [Andreprevotia sp. IGB-42]|uniref:YkgJ family cysteine cluster protein n=1 Tax=Andreprevotia sp. IGB-42 TaxID=2497473 RepID=UPI0027E466E2|nr:YkgJ family cysteine cluster protein [Andreprevotia sp. IGB-42]